MQMEWPHAGDNHYKLPSAFSQTLEMQMTVSHNPKVPAAFCGGSKIQICYWRKPLGFPIWKDWHKRIHLHFAGGSKCRWNNHMQEITVMNGRLFFASSWKCKWPCPTIRSSQQHFVKAAECKYVTEENPLSFLSERTARKRIHLHFASGSKCRWNDQMQDITVMNCHLLFARRLKCKWPCPTIQSSQLHFVTVAECKYVTEGNHLGFLSEKTDTKESTCILRAALNADGMTTCRR